MHIISFMFRDNPQVMQFHYDTVEEANKQYLKVKTWDPKTKEAELVDDYGSNAIVRIEDLVGIFLTDVTREMAAHQKSHTLQLKAELHAQKDAQSSVGGMVHGMTPSAKFKV